MRVLLPPLPARLTDPDTATHRELVESLRTQEGREQARQVVVYLERLIEISGHNERTAHAALQVLREAMGELIA